MTDTAGAPTPQQVTPTLQQGAPTPQQAAPEPAFQPPNGNTYHDKFPLKGTLDCLAVGCPGKDVFDGAGVITYCTHEHVTCGFCHCQYNQRYFYEKNHRTVAQCRLKTLDLGQPPDHACREQLASLAGPSAELMSQFEQAVRRAGYTDGEIMDLHSKNAFLQIAREYCGSSDAPRICCFLRSAVLARYFAGDAEARFNDAYEFPACATVYANIWKLLDAIKHLKYAHELTSPKFAQGIEREMKHVPPMGTLEGLDVSTRLGLGEPVRRKLFMLSRDVLLITGASLDVKTKTWVEVDVKPYVSGFEHEVPDWMGTLAAITQKCHPAPKRERKICCKACGKLGHVSLQCSSNAKDEVTDAKKREIEGKYGPDVELNWG